MNRLQRESLMEKLEYEMFSEQCAAQVREEENYDFDETSDELDEE